MKFKIGFGEGGLKGFVLQHSEKAVFGAVLLLVVVFVYSSATQEGISMNETPEKLKSEATLARTHVTQDHWEALAPEREDLLDDFPARAEQIRTPLNDDPYAPDLPLTLPVLPGQERRADPEIFAPLDVEVQGMVAAVAWRVAPDYEDPWADSEEAILEPEEAPKPKPKTRDRRRRTDDYDMYDEEMYSDYDAMDRGASPATTRTRGRVRTVSNDFLQQHIKGFRATGGAGGAMAPVSRGIVAVTALVPYEEQWAAYQQALANAQGYSPNQDVPNYLYFVAERAEVTDDPDAPLEWRTISNTAFATRQAQRYGGTPREVAEEAYLLPGTLTMPIPPILVQSFDHLALHSQIPRFQPRTQRTRRPEPLLDDEEVDPADFDLAGGLPEMPQRRPGAATTHARDDYDDYGGYHDDYYDDGMGTGPGDRSGAGPRRVRLTQYKMVRFFDLNAQPGRSYRYRVSLILEDPNRPEDPRNDPNRQILDREVVERLDAIEAEDPTRTAQRRTAGQSPQRPRRIFFRQTEWSEPSDVITLETAEDFLAGSVTPPRFVPLLTRPGERGPEIQLGEDSGKLVSVVWDNRRAVEVPAGREVRRGAYLHFEEDADVLHPRALQIRRLPEFPFRTDSFVADLRGGATLMTDVHPVTEEETTHRVPGEFLIVDRDGNLLVRNEVETAEEYRRLMFIEDEGRRRRTATGGTGDYYDDGMGYDDYDDYGGYDDFHDDGRHGDFFNY